MFTLAAYSKAPQVRMQLIGLTVTVSACHQVAVHETNNLVTISFVYSRMKFLTVASGQCQGQRSKVKVQRRYSSLKPPGIDRCFILGLS